MLLAFLPARLIDLVIGSVDELGVGRLDQQQSAAGEVVGAIAKLPLLLDALDNRTGAALETGIVAAIDARALVAIELQARPLKQEILALGET
jgi:hypothetical protein